MDERFEQLRAGWSMFTGDRAFRDRAAEVGRGELDGIELAILIHRQRPIANFSEKVGIAARLPCTLSVRGNRRPEQCWDDRRVPNC